MGFYSNRALGRFGETMTLDPRSIAPPNARADRFLTSRQLQQQEQAQTAQALDQARQVATLNAQLEQIAAAVPEGTLVEAPSGLPTWVFVAGGAVVLVGVGALLLRGRGGGVHGYRRRRRSRR